MVFSQQLPPPPSPASPLMLLGTAASLACQAWKDKGTRLHTSHRNTNSHVVSHLTSCYNYRLEKLICQPEDE